MSNILLEIYDGWKNYVFENPIVEAEAKKRIALCVDCEHFKTSNKTCMKCGCFMVAKTRSPRSSCPVGKWLAIK